MKKKSSSREGVIVWLKKPYAEIRSLLSKPTILLLPEVLDFLIESSPTHPSYILYDKDEIHQFAEIQRFLSQEPDDIEIAMGEMLDVNKLKAVREKVLTSLGRLQEPAERGEAATAGQLKDKVAKAMKTKTAVMEITKTANDMFEGVRTGGLPIRHTTGMYYFNRQQFKINIICNGILF
jgi:hypothetical protein